jgi:succinoglycan biosynthesis transport protein ExoP
MKQESFQNPKRLAGETSGVPVRTVDVSPREAHHPEYPDKPVDEGLHEYWKIIRRHQGTVLLVAFSGALMGFLSTLPETPIYQAHATVEVRGVNENFLNMKDVNPDSGGYMDPSFDILTQVRILESGSLRQRTARKLAAKKPASFTYPTNRLMAWKKALGIGNSKPVTWEQAVAMAAGSATARVAGNTRIIDVSSDSADPEIAAEAANTLVNEFIDQSLESRLATSTLTSEWLSKQLEELKINLEKSEDQLQSYASSVGLQLTGDSSGKDGQKENVSEEKFRQLQAELLRAQAERVATQSKYELASSASADSLPQVLDDPSLREYQTRLADLRRQLAELGTSLTPANPRVQKVQAQMTELEDSLEKERHNVVSRITNDFRISERRERLISVEYEKQLLVVGDQAGKAIHYNVLKREVDTNRQIYEAMLQKVKEASIASAIRASGYRMVDPAQPPGEPYRPDPARSATLGAMGGLVVGIIVVMVRERADRSLQQPGDTAMYLNIPELGVIPSEKAASSRRLYGYGQSAISNGQGVQAANGSLSLATLKPKSGLLTESFQTVLTSILFSNGNGDTPQVLVITSANPSEGKSLVASSLAAALSEINQRVVLIDADMRRPRQHEIFHLSNERGLSDLLKEKDDRFELAALQQTGLPGLCFLASGPPVAHASNLLHSPRLGELIRALRCEFDTVIIDTPPMLHLADARVMGQYCDGVILVVRAGKTTRDAALAAMGKFREDGTPVLGTVLNDWDPGRGGYADYKGYKSYSAKYSTKS